MNCPGLDIVSLQLNWGGWDGGCVCSRSWKILAYQSAFHPAAGQSGRWRIWQVAFKDPNMLVHECVYKAAIGSGFESDLLEMLRQCSKTN